jgi:hypothetical protein
VAGDGASTASSSAIRGAAAENERKGERAPKGERIGEAGRCGGSLILLGTAASIAAVESTVASAATELVAALGKKTRREELGWAASCCSGRQIRKDRWASAQSKKRERVFIFIKLK